MYRYIGIQIYIYIYIYIKIYINIHILVWTRHKTVTGFIVHDVCSSVMYVKSTIFVTSSPEGRQQAVLDEKIGM